MATMPTTGITETRRENQAFPEASSQSTGTEWMVDAHGCDVASLRDLDLVTELCESVIADLGLHVLGRPLRHAFPHPGGVTALYMLSESHLACHTYPEYATATFNLYCCRARPAWDWEQRLKSRLRAAQVEIRRYGRGLQVGAGRAAQ